MPNDPGMAGDTCIFMEAIVGDGGNQNPNDVWWLSPDITLKGHVSGFETADQGENKISIRYHRKAEGTCTFPGDESVTVQVWVANPSLIMAPGVRGSAARVAFIGSAMPPPGDKHTLEIVFTPPVGLPSPFPLQDNPLKPGLKCLVALCYPDSQTPSTSEFFVPGDLHVAQHNLSVVKTSGTKAAFTVNTFNPAVPVQAVTLPDVTLRAVMDLAPTNFVKKMVLSRLLPLPEFQQLRTQPLPNGFGFDLTGLQASEILDHSHGVAGFPPGTNPSFEAKVKIPHTLTQVTFGANLKTLSAGEACIFHLTQTFKNQPQGGLTLVMLQT